MQRSSRLVPWGTDYGVSWYSGVTLPDNRAVRNTNPCTVMAGYISRINPQNNYGYLVAECDSGIGGGLRFMIDSYLSPLRVSFGADSTGAAGAPSTTSNVICTYGDYVDTAVTYDGGVLPSGINTYAGVNGAPAVLIGVVSSTNGSGSPKVTAGNPITLGNRPGGARATNASHFYTVKWQRILDLQEIRKVQKFGPLSVREGLVLCWANGRDWGPSQMSPTNVQGLVRTLDSPFAPRLRIGRAAFAAEVAAPSFLSAWAHRKSAVIGAGVR